MLAQLRPSHLPAGLQKHIFHTYFKNAPRLRQPIGFNQLRPKFYSQGTNFNVPRWRISRRVLFAAPAAGLLAIYFVPKPKNVLQTFFSSPAVIPCSEDPLPVRPIQLIHSPYEELSLVTMVGRFIQRYILDPILTTRRFIYLCYLFIPVLITSPMLLIGTPGSGVPGRKRLRNGRDKPGKKRRWRPGEREGERWGAIWWYGYLVRQMERAGPTFIKVGSRVNHLSIES